MTPKKKPTVRDLLTPPKEIPLIQGQIRARKIKKQSVLEMWKNGKWEILDETEDE